MTRVGSLGAYDRFNYGDLLFPHLLDRAATEANSVEFLHFAVRAADLSRLGGVEVQGSKALSRMLTRRGNDSQEGLAGLVLGGGEVGGATWGQAATSLSPFPVDRGLAAVRRRIGARAQDRLGRLLLQGRWPTPYIPDESVVGGAFTLTSNAIGVSSIANLDDATRVAVARTLSKARYLSVRDQDSVQALRRHGVGSQLAPDSAAALRMVHPNPVTEPRDGLVFQCSLDWMRRHGSGALDALAEVAGRFAALRLLPIGLAGGHSDQSALAALRTRLHQRGIRNAVLETATTTWQIADAIARAEVFVGTSLHGAITSMAYGTPHVTLAGIRKLDAYMTTWGDGLTPTGVAPEALSSAVQSALRISKLALSARAERLSALAWASTLRAIEAASAR